MARPFLVAIVALVVFAAGCTRPEGADDDQDPTPTTPSPTPAPTPTATPTPRPASPTPTPTAPPTPPPGEPTPPTPPAEPEPAGVEVFNGTFDFSGNEGLIPITATDTFEVGEGFASLVVTVNFTETGAASPTDTDRVVRLARPDLPVPILSVGSQGGNTTGEMRSDAAPGEWTLRYSGKGPTIAFIVAKVYKEGEEPEA